MVGQFIELMFSSMALGSYIAIAAIGFTLIYAIADMINFAYAEWMSVGAIIGFLVYSTGVGLPLTLVITIAATAVVGLVLARIFFTPMQDAGPIPLLLTSIGLGFVMRHVLVIMFGADPRFIDAASGRWEVLGASLYFDQALIIGLAVATMGAVHLMLHRSDVGIAMRATSDAVDLASVSGINPRRIRQYVWLLASGLAGLSGFLLAVQSTASPHTGFNVILIIIAAAILGGAGSAYGAMAGAYVIGFAITMTGAVLPTGFGSFGRSVAFLALIVVLLVRPSGIADVEVDT